MRNVFYRGGLVFGSLFCGVVLLEIVLRMSGWVMSVHHEWQTKKVDFSKHEMRILCVGESTTQGQYPVYLQRALEKRFPEKSIVVIDKGKAGTFSPLIIENLPSYIKEYAPHIIVAMMGINDSNVYLPRVRIDAPWYVQFYQQWRIYKLACLLKAHIKVKLRSAQHVSWKYDIPCAYAFSAGEDFSDEEGMLLERQQLLEKAKKYEKDHDIDNAIVCNEKAYRLLPHDDNICVTLGDLYRKKKEYAEAEEWIQRALSINAQNKNAHVVLAILHTDRGHPEQYYTHDRILQKNGLVHKDSKRYAVYMRLKQDKARERMTCIENANADEQKGDIAAAIIWLKKAYALKTIDYNICVTLGELHRRLRDFDAAEWWIQKAIALRPSQSNIYIVLGSIYQDKGEIDEAIRIGEQAIVSGNRDERLYADLIKRLFFKKRDEEALRWFNEAWRYYPKSGCLWYVRGNLYERDGDREKAEEAYKKAMVLGFREPDVLIALANVYMQKRKYNEAKELYEQVIAVGHFIEAYWGLSSVYESQQNYEEAHRVLNRIEALGLSTVREEDLLSHRASLYASELNIPEAVSHYQKALGVNEHYGPALIGLGDVARAQLDIQNAEAYYMRALTIDADDVGACIGLGWVSLTRKELHDADEWFQRALRQKGSKSDLCVRIGEACYNAGNAEMAERYFQQAIALQCYSSYPYIGLGKIYLERYYAYGPDSLDSLYRAKKYLEEGVRMPIVRADALVMLEQINGLLGEKGTAGHPTLTEVVPLSSIVTQTSYKALQHIARENGIIVVCVQYPRRPIASLKKMFDQGLKGVFFVDNEQIFNDAIARDGYGAYFRDAFAYDFGHCTEKGNLLLAENIAQTISHIIASSKKE